MYVIFRIVSSKTNGITEIHFKLIDKIKKNRAERFSKTFSEYNRNTYLSLIIAFIFGSFNVEASEMHQFSSRRLVSYRSKQQQYHCRK